MQIFCPNNHLVLNNSHCDVCGWQRPASHEVGKVVWGPKSLGSEILATSGSVDIRPCLVGDVVIFPLKSNQLVGYSFSGGSELWRIQLPDGMVSRAIFAFGDYAITALKFEKSILETGSGGILRINPTSGENQLMWQSNTRMLSNPVFLADRMVVSTSAPALLAISRVEPHDILWQQPLDFSASIPHVIGNTIVLVDGSFSQKRWYIRFFDAGTGQPLGRIEICDLLHEPLALSGDLLLSMLLHKELICYSISSAKEVWRKNYRKIYSPPAIQDNYAFFVRQSNPHSDAADHYVLQAVNLSDGEERWSLPLPDRVSAAPIIAHNTIILRGDHGNITGVSLSDKKILWQACLGSPEDPVKTELNVEVGMLLAATVSGQAAAIQIAPPEKELRPVEEYLKSGNWELAAAAYALKGDYEAAAQIYEEHPGNLQKALVLYRAAGRYEKAAILAESHGKTSIALADYRQIKDVQGEVRILLQMGDTQAAVQRLIEDNQLAQAARLLEDAGEYRQAMELYSKVGLKTDADRLWRIIPKGLTDLEQLMLQERFTEAGELALNLGKLQDAITCYERASMPEQVLAVLLKLAHEKPEDWVWQRISELAPTLNAHKDHGWALTELQRYEEAGEAFRKAAEQTSLLPDRRANEIENNRAVAALYVKAAQAYHEAGIEDKERHYYKLALAYKKYPVIEMQLRYENIFRINSWNQLCVNIRNTGYGLARHVKLSIPTDRFDIDVQSLVAEFNIGAGQNKETKIAARPKEHGEMVPLRFSVSYQAADHNNFEEMFNLSVTVEQPGVTPIGTPMNVIYNINSLGKLTQGDLYEGPVLQGNGQIGDRVVVGDENLNALGVEKATGKNHSITCPNCGKENETKFSFCKECGYPLTLSGSE